jgi:hypothetical protein
MILLPKIEGNQQRKYRGIHRRECKFTRSSRVYKTATELVDSGWGITARPPNRSRTIREDHYEDASENVKPPPMPPPQLPRHLC